MQLNIQLVSFSYKQSLPVDDSDNGGGFLFDCRCLPNPGRLPEYKKLSGIDEDVITYLEKQPTVDLFFQHSATLVDLAIDNYLERGFTHLLIGYGCTGGQHRSVYNAERLAKKLSTNSRLAIQLEHLNQSRWIV